MKSQPEATAPAVDAERRPPPVCVIMGAAVWAGGRPSNAMRRRVQGALASASGLANVRFLVSGGVGDHPPSEAAVMSALLRQSGIAPEHILLEEASHDTLSSVRNCVEILRSQPRLEDVILCSDVYHIPRCRWLFHLFGISTRPGRVASGRPENSLVRWLYYYLRELAALPWDTLMAVLFSASSPRTRES